MKLTVTLLLAAILRFTVQAQIESPILDSLTVELTNHRKDDTVKADILINLSCYTLDTPEKSRGYAEQALQIAQDLHYKAGIGQAYICIGQAYSEQSDNVKAIHFALLALKEFELGGIPRGIGGCYGLIARCYAQGKDFDKALYYYKLSYDAAKKIRDYPKSDIAAHINNIGSTFQKRGDYDSALIYYKKAVEILEAINAKFTLADGYTNIGSTYERLGNYALAHQYLFKALPLALEFDKKYTITYIYQNIGTAYCKTGNYKACSRYLHKAFQLAREIGSKTRMEGIYGALIDLETSQNNYRSAFQYLTQLSQLKDTLYNQEKFKQTAELGIRYETEKKEQTIKLLEQEQKNQAILRNSIIAGALLILIASSFIYFLQRSRARKSKELLTIQQALNDKLHEIDKLKTSFFANISHEFRTPLTLILVPLEEELKKRPVSEQQSLLLIKRNANRLLDLVNQLLDISKLEARKMKLVLKQDNMVPFLKVVAASFDSWAQHKQINFIRNIEVTEQPLWYDQDKLEKIITNLLANAFKFTPAHGIVTFVITNRKEEGKNKLLIIIADTGKGIPEEEQEHIFSSFYQTQQTLKDQEGGTGLGLSLVKGLVKLYDGRISLQSVVNVGSTFRVEIPLDREAFVDAQINEITSSPSFSSVNRWNGHDYSDKNATVPESSAIEKDAILIVEDNADLRNFMTTILEQDYAVLTASNGEEGLELALTSVPSLILTDLMMPKIDGIQLTEKIKNDERTSHVPVVLLTAKNEQPSRLEGLRAGIDDYLTKPFSTEELLVRIANLIGQRKKLALRFRERVLIPVTSTTESSLDDKFLYKVKETVESHMHDPDFSVEKLADEIHLTRKQLLRKLKALTGLTPSDFIREMRLKKAAEMIRQKTDTITQVGYAVGFNDQSYFSKSFKKEFGVTPTEYADQFEQ